MNRRKILQGMAAGIGATLGNSLVPDFVRAAPAIASTPKRVIFFMQNHGFDPRTAIPSGMTSSGSLAKAKLPESIEPLEPYKERMHIINGLHGMLTSPKITITHIVHKDEYDVWPQNSCMS